MMQRTGDPYVLAIDLGTTAVKATVFSNSGRPIARSGRDVQLHLPQAHLAEVNPDEWWRITVECIRDVVAALGPDTRLIKAVGVCGLKHAPVLLDERGKPIAPAVLWMDQRCSGQAGRLATEYGHVFERVCGSLPSTTSSAAKMRWLREQEPATQARLRHFMLPKDYIRYRLTGEIATDLSDAEGTGLLDADAGEWSEELLDLVGLDECVMPQILRAHDMAGRVTAEAARETGLMVGTSVAVGGSDVHCTMLGAGMWGRRWPDIVCLYVGTAAWIVRLRAGCRREPRISDTEWVGATATSGAAFTWLKNLLLGGAPGATAPECLVAGNLGLDNPYEILTRMAATVEPGSEGLCFHPHLSGERGPRENSKATGAFFGLTLRHQRAHLARAVMEGVAYSIRAVIDSYNGRPIDQLAFVGGASVSLLWRDIISAVTGRTLAFLRTPDATAAGCAMVAGVCEGLFRDAGEAGEAFVAVAGKCVPDPDLRDVYQVCYRRYEESESVFESLWR